MPVASASEPQSRAGPRRGAAERELRGGAGAGQREDAERGHDVVVGVQQRGAERRAERDEQAADRPARDHGQRGKEERAPDDRRDARALRRELHAAGRLRRARASAARRRRRSRRARAARRTGARAARGRARRAARRCRCRGPCRRRWRRRWSGRPRRGCGVGCRSSSAALAAPSARPVARPWMPRATNSQTVESASMNRTLVAISVPSEASSTGRRPISSESAAGEQQRGQHAERVRRVDQRQHDRREAPELAVGAVEGRRSAGREQREADHRRDVRVGDAGDSVRRTVLGSTCVLSMSSRRSRLGSPVKPSYHAAHGLPGRRTPPTARSAAPSSSSDSRGSS